VSTKNYREWPRPILIEKWNGKVYENIDAWDSEEIEEKKEQMPIILTDFPDTNTAFNVTEMNRKVVQKAFKKGKED
jgi:poly(A) polymerase Pap1